MPKFTLHHGAFATTTTLKTVAKIEPISTLHVELVFLSLTGAGSVAPNATDLNFEFGVAFLSGSVAGTFGTNPYVPEQWLNKSAIARCVYKTNASVEPTVYNTNPFLFGGFNQRNGYAWGVPDGEGPVIDPAATGTVDNMGVRVRSSLAHSADFNAHVIEP